MSKLKKDKGIEELRASWIDDAFAVVHGAESMATGYRPPRCNATKNRLRPCVVAGNRCVLFLVGTSDPELRPVPS